MAGLLLGTGTLGDRIGHRRMFLIGLVLFGVASIVAAYSPTAEILIGARAFLAVGAAAMMPATLALIRVTFEDDRERNIAIAIWGRCRSSALRSDRSSAVFCSAISGGGRCSSSMCR